MVRSTHPKCALKSLSARDFKKTMPLPGEKQVRTSIKAKRFAGMEDRSDHFGAGCGNTSQVIKVGVFLSPRLDMRLCRLLLEEGLLRVETLEAAIQRQVSHGGGLDTLLLELGVLDEETLSGALCIAWDTTPAPRAFARRPAPNATALLPGRIASAAGICPIFIDDDGLHIMLRGPIDTALLQEVRDITASDLVPHVVPEVRLHRALHVAYGTPLEERFASLAQQLDSESGFSSVIREATPELGASSVLEVEGNPTDAWSLSQALSHLDSQVRRADVAQVVVAYARQFLPFAALFGIRGDVAVGWARSGPSESVQFTRRLLPVPAGSLLERALKTPSPLVARPSSAEGDLAMLGWLGRRRPRGALLVPVVVAQRNVAVFYGDTGIRGAQPDQLNDLVAFSARIGPALESLLRNRHQQNASLLPHVAQAPLAPVPVPASRVAATESLPSAPPPKIKDGTSPFAQGYAARMKEDESASKRATPSKPPASSPVNSNLPRHGAAPEPASISALDIDDEEALYEPAPSLPPTLLERDPPNKFGRAADHAPPRSDQSAKNVPEEDAMADLYEEPQQGSFADDTGDEAESSHEDASQIEQNDGLNGTSFDLSTASHTARDDDDVDNDDDHFRLGRFLPDLRAEPTHALVAALFSANEKLVRAAQEALIDRGPEAKDLLSKNFPGPLWVDPLRSDARLEQSADLGPLVEVLEALGKDGLDAVLPYLDSKNPTHRYIAVFLMRAVPDERAIRLLRPRLADPVPRIQLLAAEALVHFRRHPNFQGLLGQLRGRLASPLHEARLRATWLLGYFVDVEAVPLIIQQLEQRDARLVRAAQVALREITLQDLPPRPRPWRRWWNKCRDQKRTVWLIEGLRSKNRDLRDRACRELTKLAGTDFGYRADDAKRTREAAVKSFVLWEKEDRANGADRSSATALPY